MYIWILTKTYQVVFQRCFIDLHSHDRCRLFVVLHHIFTHTRNQVFNKYICLRDMRYEKEFPNTFNVPVYVIWVENLFTCLLAFFFLFPLQMNATSLACFSKKLGVPLLAHIRNIFYCLWIHPQCFSSWFFFQFVQPHSLEVRGWS